MTAAGSQRNVADPVMDESAILSHSGEETGVAHAYDMAAQPKNTGEVLFFSVISGAKCMVRRADYARPADSERLQQWSQRSRYVSFSNLPIPGPTILPPLPPPTARRLIVTIPPPQPRHALLKVQRERRQVLLPPRGHPIRWGHVLRISAMLADLVVL